MDRQTYSRINVGVLCLVLLPNLVFFGWLGYIKGGLAGCLIMIAILAATALITEYAIHRDNVEKLRWEAWQESLKKKYEDAKREGE